MERYEGQVAVCRELGVLTPEDPYARWEGEDGPVLIAPLFVGYDYSFHAPGATNKEESLEIAHAAGSSAPTSTTCSPTRTRPATPGAARGRRRPRRAWPPATCRWSW
ncbi:hypothetical protein ACFQV2_27160 [Actinokineospora soli]|uniref:Uncharacterized protein n=1 Tax=Actinokineospora soli TaxID=1048753 RepID=A0ABW2TSX4_9PSEU